MRVTIVAANSLEYDSRLRRTAIALAEDGHAVTLVGWAREGLPEHETLPGGIDARRVALDLRLTSAFRPLPEPARRLLARLLGSDPSATVLPPARARGFDRLRAPLRRAVEIVAHLRRTGPWTDAVVRAVPGTDVYHAKALIALPVVRAAARRTGARFVYDIADIHVEAARLARLPAPLRRLVAGREARWMREAAGLTAVSDAVADEVVRRSGVPRPVVLLNAPPAYRPDDPAPPPDEGVLRAAAGLPPERAIVLFQGGLSIDRGIEELVAALDVPPLRDRDVAVVLLGYGRLHDTLRAEAERRPGRLVVLDAVPQPELLGYTAGAAVSYVGQPPRTLNQRLNLANKLFESIMAGVPVVVAEGTEHARVVAAEGLGTAADLDDPAAVGRAIATLLDEPPEGRRARREHVRRVALERYTWETARAGVVGLYRELAGGPARGSSPPSVCLLLNNPFVTDSRSWKIARSLSEAGYRVTVLAREGDGLPAREERDGVTVVRVAQPRPRWLPAPPLPDAAPATGPRAVRLARDTIGRAAQGVRYLWLTRAWARALGSAAPPAAIWQSEGLITLPVALTLARRRGGRVVYDSRDVHVESARFARLPGPWRRLLRDRERRWVAAADALVTVSEPYRDVLERSLGRPVDAIVMNCPPRWTPPDPPRRILHERLGLDPATRVVLYLGQVAPHRGIEELIEAIGLVEQAVLVVAGFGAAYEAYRARAAASPHADRVRFLPGVPPDEIAALNAAADVAAMPVQGTTLNHRLNTPTKLFDAIGAGTPVVASDLPGMAPIVRATGAGVLCDPADPADIARAIREIVDAPPERRAELRAACLRAAATTYAWEPQVERLLALYARLGVPAPGAPSA